MLHTIPFAISYLLEASHKAQDTVKAGKGWGGDYTPSLKEEISKEFVHIFYNNISKDIVVILLKSLGKTWNCIET